MRVFVVSSVVVVALIAFGASRVNAQRRAGAIEGALVGVPSDGPAIAWLEGVPAGAWQLPSSVPTLTQHGAMFHPEFLAVVAGQTVAFPNDDSMAHNVFSVSPTKRFDLGHYGRGETRTVLFDRAGIVDVFCNIHDTMHATIVVVPSTFYALPDASGHVSFHDVPLGSYRLVAYAPSAGSVEAPVVVGADAVARVSVEFAHR